MKTDLSSEENRRKILRSAEAEYELLGGGVVMLRKLKKKELREFITADPADKVKMEALTTDLIQRTIVAPALTKDEIDNMDLDVSQDLQRKVMEFNGLTEEAQKAMGK